MSEKNTVATWRVYLTCKCPRCKEYVDLLAHPDYWEQHQKVAIAEHETDQTRDMRVCCPECGGGFDVDLAY